MESKDKITEKKCLEIFKLLELESGIYNLEIKNIPIWWMIRFRFYERLYDEITKKEKGKIYFNKNKRIIKDYRFIFFFFVRSIIGLFIFFTNKNKNKIFFLTYSQNKKKLGSSKSVDLLEYIISEGISSKDLIIIEQMDLFNSSIDFKKNKIFMDGLIIVSFFKNFFCFFSSIEIKNWTFFKEKIKKIEFNYVSSEWVLKNIEELIISSKNKFLIQIRTAEILINKFQPRLIIETTSYNSGTMALNYFARKKNIPIIEVQHGVITKYHLGYIYFLPKENKISLLPDKILVYGKFFKNIILKNSLSFFSNNIEIIGSLRISEFLKDNQNKIEDIKKEIRKIINIDSNAFLINFSSDMYTSDLIIDFLGKILPFLENNIFISIKIHPMDNKKEQIIKYKKITDQYSNVRILTDNDIDLYYLLVSCDVNVTLYSTIFMECLFLGVPNIILNFENKFNNFFSDDKIFENIIKVNNDLEFLNNINKLIKNRLMREEYINYGKIISNDIFLNKVNTRKEIIEIIKSYL